MTNAIKNALEHRSGTDNRVWIVLALLFVLSLPAVTPRIYASDEIEYFAYLRSLWFDRDVSFENEYRYFHEKGLARSPGFHETFLERSTETGRRINFGTLGCAILWAPFYAAGDIAARVMHAAGRSVEVDGFSSPYIASVCYGSAVYGFIAVLLSLDISRRVVGVGVVPALAVWLGTPLLFYMYVTPPMSHACSAFAVSAFVLTWLVVRKRWSLRGLTALGGVAALMTMVREQDFFLVAGPALDLAWTVLTRLRRSHATTESARLLAVRVLAAIVTFGVVFLPQALSYLSLNGRLGPSQLVTRKMTWWSPHLFQVLLSPEHGFLFWTPLAALGILGLALAILVPSRLAESDATTQVAVCVMVMLVSQVYIAGSVESWTVAGAFGQRRFVALTPLLAIGIAALMRNTRSRWSGAFVMASIIVCMWWNVGLMAQFGGGLMDRQRLELGRNAYVNFVVLPRSLPSYLYRYIFDRQSFYKTMGEPPGAGDQGLQQN